MQNLSTLVLVASLSFIAGVGLTYVAKTPWSSDMADQPSIKPQEQPRLPPNRSVPTDQMGGTPDSGNSVQSEGGDAEMGHSHGPGSAGTSGHHHDSSGASEAASPKTKNTPHDHGDNKAPGHTHDHSSHSHGPVQAAKAAQKHSHDTQAASMHAHNGEMGEGHAHGDGASASLQTATPKPVKATPTSIRQGEELFNIYCAVCHGSEGQGGMPMEKALPVIPKFTTQLLRRESDPHMFSMVTGGHGPMPGYGEALMPEERWHVINYLRSLQSRLAERERSKKGAK